jgi:hypothetical protein
MASLLPALAGAAPAAGAAAAPAAATGFAGLGAAAPAAAAPYAAGVAAPAVAAAAPALAPVAAPAFGAGLAGAANAIGKTAAAPAFGNNLGLSYGQLAQLARSQGNAADFRPIAGSIYDQRQNRNAGLQGPTMQGLPLDQKQPDTLDNMLNFFRNIGSL